MKYFIAIFSVLTILVLLILVPRAKSQVAETAAIAADDWSAEILRARVSPFLDALSLMNPETATAVVAAQKAPSPLAHRPKTRQARVQDQNCVRFYSRLYANRVVDVRVAFGYIDDTPYDFVLDPYLRTELEMRMIAACPDPGSGHRLFLCGFSADPKDPDVFSKPVADAYGRPKVFRVRITNGGFTPSGIANRADDGENAQAKQSAKAKNGFIDGLSHAAVTYYLGHSRGGGGPDFSPPILVGSGDEVEVNYPAYLRGKRGFTGMVQALKARNPANPAALVALLSCSSDEEFGRAMIGASRESTFLFTNHEAEIDSMFLALLGNMNGLLGQACEADLMGMTNGPGTDPASQVTYYSR